MVGINQGRLSGCHPIHTLPTKYWTLCNNQGTPLA